MFSGAFISYEECPKNYFYFKLSHNKKFYLGEKL